MRRLLLLLAAVWLLAACAGAKPQAKPALDPAHRFVFFELTAVDQGTGLVWARNANLPGRPLAWKGDGNVYGFIQNLNRENWAGYSDWRLPRRAEFEGLLAHAKALGYDPHDLQTWPNAQLVRSGFVDVRDYEYWSSSRDEKDSRLLWAADFARGEMTPRHEGGLYGVWPVRGGQ